MRRLAQPPQRRLGHRAPAATSRLPAAVARTTPLGPEHDGVRERREHRRDGARRTVGGATSMTLSRYTPSGPQDRRTALRDPGVSSSAGTSVPANASQTTTSAEAPGGARRRAGVADGDAERRPGTQAQMAAGEGDDRRIELHDLLAGIGTRRGDPARKGEGAPPRCRTSIGSPRGIRASSAEASRWR
jgi:hypothetical protein